MPADDLHVVRSHLTEAEALDSEIEIDDGESRGQCFRLLGFDVISARHSSRSIGVPFVHRIEDQDSQTVQRLENGRSTASISTQCSRQEAQ